MNNLKPFKISIVVLIALNLALLGFIYFKKPPHPNQDGPRKLIIEKLNFDDNQIKEYDKLIEWHKHEIQIANDNILVIKNKIYSLVLENEPYTLKDSLLGELGKLQSRIENIHFKHFTDIRNICHQNQKQAFAALINEIAELFNGPKGKKR